MDEVAQWTAKTSEARRQLVQYSENKTFVRLIGVAFILLAYTTFSILHGQEKKANAPYVGYRSKWEPTLWLRLRFMSDAWPIIMDGYRRYKDSMFYIRRHDRDILIMSNKYIDELRTFPEEKLSGVEADVENLRGPYYLDTILRSNLHTRSLNQKLTPNLEAYVDLVREELHHAMQVEMPEASDWTEVSIGDLFLRILARVSARFIVGLPLCRDGEWLRVSTVVGVNVFSTVLILRALPQFLRPLHHLIVRCLPTWYKLHENLHVARRSIAPILIEYAEKKHDGKAHGNDVASPLLTWMYENALTDVERDPVNLAHRMLFLGLGSIHTTASQAAHAIHDLAARPELVQCLREEIDEVTTAEKGWKKAALMKMWKLESFMSESQRMNPPALSKVTRLYRPQHPRSRAAAVFHRLAMEPLTLSDGTHISKGTFIAIAAASILLDPDVIPDPQKFDAFRNYRERLEPGESARHQYATVDKDHMHFGHGRHACPGRALAVNELKLILGAFLTHYDLDYPAKVREDQ